MVRRRFSARRLGCAALLAAALGPGAALAGDDEVRLEVGLSFPPITLPLLADGSPASIVDFRGEKIIMHVFASW